MMLPNALIQSLQHVKGFNEESFIAVHEAQETLTSIRLNAEKKVDISFLPFIADDISWCPYGKYLSQRPSFTFDPLLHAGAYYVQEGSSMFLWEVLKQIVGVNTNKKVLDLCAAPGGKTTLLSNYFNEGLIVSNEVIKARVTILQENCIKWGADNIVVTNNDPQHFEILPNFFDVIVVDAPCSGSGLFRKDKNAINQWSEENVNLCNQRQQRILANVMNCLKDEGILIYSTCSYSTQENEDIIDWVLTHFEMESLSLNLDNNWGIIETQSIVKKGMGYRFYPDKVKGEGFFIAVFRNKKVMEKTKKYKQKKLILETKQSLAILNNYIPFRDEDVFIKHQENILFSKAKWLQTIEILSAALYLKKVGICIGSIKNQQLIPEHDYALSTLNKDVFNKIDVSLDQAIAYLQRKEILINAPNGWALLVYCELPIGWVKVLPNRVNNYYPKDWRILKEYF